MTKRLLTGLLVGSFILALGIQVVADDAEKAKAADAPQHEYVGVKKCKICHKKDGIFESWMHTTHAYAFDSLSAEDQKKEELLPYYTTGTTKKGDLLTGIQCEACHGPGSDYKKKKIMSDAKLAAENGLIMPDSAACMKCHNEKAPAALAMTAKEFDFAKMREKGVHAVAATEGKAEKKE